ncbi:MAG: ABC transporter permease [Clostridia bacterium]|nr:ABC transporter permease [Clostridia bacterium]
MKKHLRFSYLGLLLLFLYAPLLLLIVSSFNTGGDIGTFTGFSFKWYTELFTNPRNDGVLQALYITIGCAGIAAAVSMAFGTLAALGIFSLKKGVRGFLLNITYLPILNPDIVTGVSLMVLLALIRIPLGFFTMVLAHISFNVPYVIFAVLPKLGQLDMHTYEAALDLGATPRRALTKVVIPQIMPGIVTGGLLAFTLSMDDFVISYFASGDVENLSVFIYSMVRKGVTPEMNALSALMFILVLGLLLAVNRRSDAVLQF